MHCGSFSKSLAPGYRVGWVAAGRYTERLVRKMLTTSLGTSVLVQLALARLLEKASFERHLRVLRATLELQSDHYVEVSAENSPSGTHISGPSDGYVLCVELTGQVDALALARQAGQDGISLAPERMFYMAGGLDHFIRINFGHPLDGSPRGAISRLGALAKQVAP